MTIDFPQGMVDMLPRADAKWRFKSCAIVGNSGGLLGSKYGAAIDGHDAVWRINYAPISRWAEDVGTRTTFDLINQQHTKRFVVGGSGSGSGSGSGEDEEGEVPGRSRGESSHATPRDSIIAVFEVTGNYARKHLYAGLMRRRGTLRGSGLGVEGDVVHRVAAVRLRERRRSRRRRRGRLRRRRLTSREENEDGNGGGDEDVNGDGDGDGDEFDREAGAGVDESGEDFSGGGGGGDEGAERVTAEGTYNSGVAIFSPELILHAQEVWDRMAPQVHAMHAGAGKESLGKAGKAMSGVYAVVLSAQVCERQGGGACGCKTITLSFFSVLFFVCCFLSSPSSPTVFFVYFFFSCLPPT